MLVTVAALTHVLTEAYTDLKNPDTVNNCASNEQDYLELGLLLLQGVYIFLGNPQPSSDTTKFSLRRHSDQIGAGCKLHKFG